MKTALRKLTVAALQKLASSRSPEQLFAQTGRAHFGVFYHVVDDAPCPHLDPLYSRRTIADFESEIDWLLAHFEPISLDELKLVVQGKDASAGRPRFHLSFDDGLRQMSEIVAPILKRKGVPATFFINSAFLDNAELFYRFKTGLLISNPKVSTADKALAIKFTYLEGELLDKLCDKYEIDSAGFLASYRPFMSATQVTGLLQDGFSIGAHSHDHPRYSLLSQAQQLEQSQRCKEILETKFSVEIDTLAFPFTDDGLTLQNFAALHESGFALTFGGAGIKEDIFRNLQRYGPEQAETHLADQLKGELAWYNFRKRLNRHRISRVE